jgi:multidrug efflux pump subunit AcrB
VRLADVATVTLGPAPPRSITRIDGDPVVTLTLDRTPASAMLDVAAAVRARLDALAPTLPEGTRLLVADDRSTDVRAQLRDLTWRGGLGLVLVVLVLLAMLKSLRAVGVVLFTVAVAQAVALALMGPLGLTLNLLTLAGLALVFGLLVDNSVVVTEQLVLQRARRGEGEGGAAAARALGAVGLPLLGGTLTTMAVMGPLVYLSGELRALFVPFGVLVALTLGASLLSAAALVPACARFLPPPHAAPHARAPRWLRQAVQAPYAFAARAPRLTLAALVLLLGTPLWLLPETLDAEPPADPTAPLPLAQKRLADLYDATVGSETGQAVRAWLDPALGGLVRPFVRETTFGSPYDFSAEPAVRVYLGFPPGTPIGRADTLLARFEQTALASPATRRTLARISERQATLRVLFTDAALGTAEPYLVRERLIREAVLLAGLDVSVGGLVPQGYYSGLGGNISGLAVQAFGPNYDDLEALCERFAARMQRASRRVVGVDIDAGRYGRQTPRTVLRFRIDADAQARTGVAPARLAARLRPVLTTRFPAFYADLDGVPRLPVRIVVAGADDLDVTALADRPLPLGDSLQVKLKTLARYRVAQVPSRIERRDQQYRRYLRIDFRGPPTMGSDLLDRVLDEMPLPAGYRLARDRGFFTAATARSFGGLLAGTVVLVFLVTAIVFESWRLPLVVLLSVPTAAVGVAIGFLWTEAAFAEGAFIGTVLLVGIAANDSILLTDRYRSLRRAHPHADAGRLARLAVRARLRPMWTTTLSSVVAMLPLLVFPHEGGGGAFWTGLAVTVTGGLLASTLLAPPATVALLGLGERRRNTRGKM